MIAWMITWVNEDFGYCHNYFLNKENAIEEGKKVLAHLCEQEEFNWLDLSEALAAWEKYPFLDDVIQLQQIPFADGDPSLYEEEL